MKKAGALARLEQVRARAEADPTDGTVGLEVVDILLDYINDPHIRTAVEAVPFVEVVNDNQNPNDNETVL